MNNTDCSNRKIQNLTVLLIGNYGYDCQESMRRFAELLHRELPKHGIRTELIRPEPWIGRLKPSPVGIGKWLGYVDKFFIFPFVLRKKIRALRETIARSSVEVRDLIVHICDHSNAHYVHHIHNVPHIVMCHDLIAIRAAMGEFSNIRIKWTGRIYQRLIVSGMKRARNIAFDSEATLGDCERIIGKSKGFFGTIHIPINYPYSPMDNVLAEECLNKIHIKKTCRFILHVGTEVWYKNRLGVMSIFSRISDLSLKLIMVGPPINPEFTRRYGIEERVHTCQNLSNETLQALYSRAECLLFPSIEEGFGWPIVEAQACGCPVVTTIRRPMTEVGGEAAVYIDPAMEDVAAAAVESVLSRSRAERAAWKERGLKNAARFSTVRIIGALVNAYDCVISEEGKASAKQHSRPL